MRQHFTYFLGALGATNPIPGFIIKKTGTHKGIAIVAGLGIAFTAVWIVGSLFNKDKFNWVFYLAFAFFSLWRYWGYGVCSLYVPTVFPDRQAGFGLIFGTMSFIAGTLSVGFGAYITNLVQENPMAVQPVWITFAVLAVLADLFTIGSMVTLIRQSKESQSLLSPKSPLREKEREKLYIKSDRSIA